MTYESHQIKEDLNSTRQELIKFLHKNRVNVRPIFYTTQRVCLEYLSGYYDILSSTNGNPTELFPTLEIFKQGFKNMTSRGIKPDVATVLLSDPSMAVIEGFPENANEIVRNDAIKIASSFEELISKGMSELDAAYKVKKFSTGNPNYVNDIPEIVSNTPRNFGFRLGDLF